MGLGKHLGEIGPFWPFSPKAISEMSSPTY
jgi:hypothetical protein